jgi:hypothetical protein
MCGACLDATEGWADTGMEPIGRSLFGFDYGLRRALVAGAGAQIGSLGPKQAGVVAPGRT